MIKNKSEKNKSNRPVNVPKPSKGTPNLNHLKICWKSIIREIEDVTTVKKIDIFNGFVEKENNPFSAKLKTPKVFACDSPENLFCLSNSTPIDLKPTHAKKPL